MPLAIASPCWRATITVGVQKVTQTYANPIPTILAAMLAEICNGEVKQLRAAGNASLAPKMYFEIIGKKTAELFAACAECGAIAAAFHAGAKPGPKARDAHTVRSLREFGRAFGMAFQIRDDILDYTATQAELGKPAGSDLREKKMTLPLILALEDDRGPLRQAVAALFAPGCGCAEAAAHLQSCSKACAQARHPAVPGRPPLRTRASRKAPCRNLPATPNATNSVDLLAHFSRFQSKPAGRPARCGNTIC